MAKEDPSAPPSDDVYYPSFPQASRAQPPLPPMPDMPAMPVAQPVYHYNQAQYLQPQQQPLMQQQYPVQQAYVLPPYSGDYRREGCCGMTLKLVLFHVLNAILGISAFSIVTTGISLSFGLIPLCCFGLVIFRVLLFVVRFLAQLDVELYNYISPPQEHVYLSIPQRAGFFGMQGRRLAPSLSAVSPLSLMATVYFMSIKFAMGILSLIIVMIAISLPIGEILALTTNPEDMIYVVGVDVHQFNLDTDPVGFTVAMICLFVISLALMHIVARLSRAATRFFCCERFSTYRYIQDTQFPVATQYPVATSAYGTATTH